MVTDSNRDIVSAIAYHPFGESDTEEGSEYYLFNGKEKEKDETGLYHIHLYGKHTALIRSSMKISKPLQIDKAIGRGWLD